MFQQNVINQNTLWNLKLHDKTYMFEKNFKTKQVLP